MPKYYRDTTMSKNTIPIKGSIISSNEYPTKEEVERTFTLHVIVGRFPEGDRFYAGTQWTHGDPEEPPFPVVFKGSVMAELHMKSLLEADAEVMRSFGEQPDGIRIERVTNRPDLKVMTLR